ncbi:MAG: Spy/CpxP family protein refolding chaperone [Magnetococcales bacterium]|nr:Spy/CpxP family protein refolding chaperone [Magnetococcales bacterium]
MNGSLHARMPRLVAALALALGLSWAGEGFAHGMGMGPGMGGGWMPGAPVGCAPYASDLKTRLGITPEQEKAWQAYEQAVQSLTNLRAEKHAAMWGSMTQSPTDREATHLAFMERMLAGKKAVLEAYQTLRSQLSDAQRSAADRGAAWSCPGPGFMERNGWHPQRHWRHCRG